MVVAAIVALPGGRRYNGVGLNPKQQACWLLRRRRREEGQGQAVEVAIQLIRAPDACTVERVRPLLQVPLGSQPRHPSCAGISGGRILDAGGWFKRREKVILLPLTRDASSLISQMLSAIGCGSNLGCYSCSFVRLHFAPSMPCALNTKTAGHKELQRRMRTASGPRRRAQLPCSSTRTKCSLPQQLARC